jgi:hypothetical protein
LGCSPIKAVRELGLERRETVDCAVYKFGYLLETPSIWWYSPSVGNDQGSENPSSADNQQERPVANNAGFAEKQHHGDRLTTVAGSSKRSPVLYEANASGILRDSTPNTSDFWG